MKQFYIIVALIGLLSSSCQSNTSKKETKKATEKDKNTEVSKSEDDSINNKESGAVKHIYGIDISQYQGDEVDLMSRKKDSLKFIICKATEGITYTDPNFDNNWKMISENGYIRGAYHFYRSNDDAQSQADNYLNAIASIKKTDIPPIVDFEEGSIVDSQSTADIQTNLLKFLNIIEKQTNRTPMIYTDINTGNKYLDSSDFSNYPLWIANYTDAKQPDLPNAWKDKGWYFWQQSDDYNINSTINDFDIFNGNLIDLKAFIKTH